MELDQESVVELTPRELAIARDEDPDAIEATEEIVEPVTDEPNGSAKEGAQDQETESKDVPESWIDDSTLELAKSYDLDEEALKSFSSAEEFRKAAVLFDRQLTKAKPERQEQTQPETKAETPAEKAERIALDLAKFTPEAYDEDTIQLVKFAKQLEDEGKAAREQLEKIVPFIQRLQEERVVEEYKSRLSAFHDAVDELDNTLVGRSRDEQGRFLKIDQKHDEARRKIFDAADSLARGLQAKGRELPPMKVLVKRAAQMELGEELSKLEAVKRQQELEKQSKKRRPVATQRPLAGPTATRQKPKTLNDEIAEIANSPELVKLWEERNQK
jgi:hypothetical protein